MLVVKPIAKMRRLSLVQIDQADLPGIEGLSGGGPQGPCVRGKRSSATCASISRCLGWVHGAMSLSGFWRPMRRSRRRNG